MHTLAGPSGDGENEHGGGPANDADLVSPTSQPGGAAAAAGNGGISPVAGVGVGAGAGAGAGAGGLGGIGGIGGGSMAHMSSADSLQQRRT